MRKVILVTIEIIRENRCTEADRRVRKMRLVGVLLRSSICQSVAVIIYILFLGLLAAWLRGFEYNLKMLRTELYTLNCV